VDFTNGDDVENDREEKILLSKWLTEVASTRSDTYVAYIRVVGYPADDFTANNGRPVETARAIAVFDRSNVRQGDDTVEMKAFRRVR